MIEFHHGIEILILSMLAVVALQAARLPVRG